MRERKLETPRLCTWKLRKRDRRTERGLIGSEVKGLMIIPSQQQNLVKVDTSHQKKEEVIELGEMTEVMELEEVGMKDRGRETSTGFVVLTVE